MRHARPIQALIISWLDYGNALLFNIPLSDKPPTGSTEPCCTSGDMHSQKRTYNTSWSRYTGFLYVSDDRKIYTSENAPIRVLFNFEGIQQCMERNPSKHQLPGYGTRCQTTLNFQQVQTYFARFLKPIYLNWRIYNF